MTLYISGPMTGIEGHNYPAFHAARDELQTWGYDVISPADLPLRDDWDWGDYMDANIASVFAADGIATLEGWKASKGARIECRIAECRNIPIHSVTEWAPK